MIKTFVSQGNQWAQVTAAGVNSVTVDACMNTWDPTKIDWNDYTTTPVPMDITWTGPYNGPYDNIGGGGMVPIPNYGPLGCGPFINGDFNFGPLQVRSELSKPAGVRPDVLMGFFSQYVHALLFIADGSTYVVPFMERLGMIWLQHELNKWTAYDRKEFYAFIDNPDATVFVGTTLNKREVQRTMSEAKDE